MKKMRKLRRPDGAVCFRFWWNGPWHIKPSDNPNPPAAVLHDAAGNLRKWAWKMANGSQTGDHASIFMLFNQLVKFIEKILRPAHAIVPTRVNVDINVEPSERNATRPRSR